MQFRASIYDTGKLVDRSSKPAQSPPRWGAIGCFGVKFQALPSWKVHDAVARTGMAKFHRRSRMAWISNPNPPADGDAPPVVMATGSGAYTIRSRGRRIRRREQRPRALPVGGHLLEFAADAFGAQPAVAGTAKGVE